MFGSEIESVWYATNDDRAAQLAADARRTAPKQRRQRVRTGGYYRAAVARALIALATRIAPPVTAPNPGTGALVQ